jgi:outer membrane protein OmpA-like peptidoglycan-associated protein
MVDYGILKPIVEGAGAIVNAGIALVALIRGKIGFEPPVAGREAIVRILSILCGVMAGLLWAFGRGQLDTLTFEWIAGVAAMSTLVALVAYTVAWLALCFTCADDPKTRYLRGLSLKRPARAVLGGDLNQPAPYGPVNVQPANTRVYFCSAGRDPSFLWEDWSLTLAGALMVVLFAWLLLSASIALTSVVMVTRGPAVKIETGKGGTHVELPADVLFAFDKANLLPSASPELKRTAKILRARAVKTAIIEGYADAKGSAAHNQILSERRAAAVWDWLEANGGLGPIDVHTVGLGASNARAPNLHADGSDNPEGRARNRRVEIVFAS